MTTIPERGRPVHPILPLFAPIRRRVAVAAALALAVLPAACAPLAGGAGRTVDGACPETLGQEVLRRMNDVRSGEGLHPLVVDLRLVRAARAHAENMAENDFFSHVGPDGMEPAERVAATGYAWTFVAENLAAGENLAPDGLTPTQVVAGWLESPLHRDNMLEPAAVHVGIARAAARDGLYRDYWTAVFADTDGEAETTPGNCHP